MKLGERLLKMSDWLKSFKIAYVNDDTELLLDLVENFDENSFKNLEEKQEAASLISHAIELLNKKQTQIQNEIKKLQSAKKYAL